MNHVVAVDVSRPIRKEGLTRLNFEGMGCPKTVLGHILIILGMIERDDAGVGVARSDLVKAIKANYRFSDQEIDGILGGRQPKSFVLCRLARRAKTEDEKAKDEARRIARGTTLLVRAKRPRR
mgnify:CR=1 FL=1